MVVIVVRVRVRCCDFNFWGGVLFAVSWLVPLWHALALVGIRFASSFVELQRNWCAVLCLFSFWWQRSVRAFVSFSEWWFRSVL